MTTRFQEIKPDLTVSELFKLILKPEKNYYIVAIIYSIAVSVLMLAIPISVQALINTVVNTKIEYFIYVLAGILFTVLVLTVVILACREYVMELFQRRFFARITAETNLRLVYSSQKHVETINRTDLVNRFFEVMHVQKIVPQLLTHGFSIFLQTVVGLIVVSFYHPYLLIYSALFALFVYVIWKTWAAEAINRAQKLSNTKYELVHWMEEIARANHFFKSEKAIDYAIKATDRRTYEYLKHKKRFFKTTFSQTLCFFALFCVAHAILLGLGGKLVAYGQLSIGQLIGAELIMAAIIYNLSYMAYYMRMYYELCASVDKLGYFFNLPTEMPKGAIEFTGVGYSLSFKKVGLNYRNHEFFFDLDIPFGKDIAIRCTETSGSKVFTDLMRGYRPPDTGSILIDGQDIKDYDIYKLREKILVVDSPMIVEGSIRSLFEMMNPDITHAQIDDLLDAMDIKSVVDAMPARLDTVLVPTGYPLLPEEVVSLKLAIMLAAQPDILIISEIVDAMTYQKRQKIMNYICMLPHMTVICFTNKNDYDIFDEYQFLDTNKSYKFDSLNDFRDFSIAFDQEAKT